MKREGNPTENTSHLVAIRGARGNIEVHTMGKGWRKEEVGVEVGKGADIAEGRALLKKKVEVARVLDVPEKRETQKAHRDLDLAPLRLSDNLILYALKLILKFRF